MATETEELQIKEFLKRTEIRTMKKDLQKLREADALEERNKIAEIKTLEEENLEQKRKDEKESEEKTKIEKILSEREKEEIEAEAGLKNYADEAEKQQIFLFESQRFDLENQIKTIEEEKEPDLKLEKNRILLEKRDWEKRLQLALEEERKLEAEQKFVSDREKESNVLSEKQSLEKRRWELEEKRQEMEKKRWAIEKKLAEMENNLKKTDDDYEKITAKKNGLREEKAEIDKTLREIYSKIISRVEGQRLEAEKERISAQGKAAETNLQEKEKIQREQWTHSASSGQAKEKDFLRNASASLKEKLSREAEKEEENRKKFMENIEKWTKK